MKPVYRQHVKAVLDGEVPRLLPGYTPFPLKLTKQERKGATLFPGSCLYSRAVQGGRLFLHFIPHARQERLQAEVGWSVSGQFPLALSSHGPLTEPADEMRECQWLIDFGELYHRRYGQGHLGWDVWRCSVSYEHPDYTRIFVAEDLEPVSEAQAHERALHAVAECIRDLQDVALPYLDEWVSLQASRWTH